MRPPRLIILLFFFIALPIFLTFLSLLSAHRTEVDTLNAKYQTRSSPLRTLFSFHTPTSLFPPSAVISLTDDNSTFFLARPADFGPGLPSKGLDGQLWVGSGFGDNTLRKGGVLPGAEGELGCSDVPGWGEGDKKHTDEQRTRIEPQRKTVDHPTIGPADKDGTESKNKRSKIPDGGDSDTASSHVKPIPNEEDGTDDHLHHPLPESNPAEPAKPGQPAAHDPAKGKITKPTHADIQSLQESAEIAGQIVLLSRGGCGFLEKVKWVQRRGGIALIVGDDERGGPLITMYARGDTSNVTIPALFTSHTTAHLLSSLIPPELLEELPADIAKDQSEKTSSSRKTKTNNKDIGPVFTTARKQPSPTGTRRPSAASNTQSSRVDVQSKAGSRGWFRALLALFGLGGETGYPWHIAEDSRRPPSSGNIDWVLLEDWDEDEPAQNTAKKPATKGSIKSGTSREKGTNSKTSSSEQLSGDDFVIGVQDWRDPDLVAPEKTKGVSKPGSKKDKSTANTKADQANPDKKVNSKLTDSDSFTGGSITPGSGEYVNNDPDHGTKSSHARPDGPSNPDHAVKPVDLNGADKGWLDNLKWGHGENVEQPGKAKVPPKTGSSGPKEAPPKILKSHQNLGGGKEHEGLWVTLTPTSMSTSPFFDTLLVLVVSPLVTLTVVYALLLLRSRIRRRRWRAPKSVVDRLPVRTYHTISSSSSTSSRVPTPESSSPTSPLLRSTPRTIPSRSRPRSQTTSGVISSPPPAGEQSSALSTPKEKNSPTNAWRKRYTGRQIECVVCLEEYIDGQSRVMSLPCGHEFHVECITPWLVTRRRTCPICKGDVVRSMAHGSNHNDPREDSENRSDDVQARAAETVNESPSASIPVPRILDDEDSDIERGPDDAEPVASGSQPAQRSNWRNLADLSLSALSGETVWRQPPADRNR